ncbi:MAG: SRPBCC domain-containing protein [Conexivisphaerales archaeon]
MKDEINNYTRSIIWKIHLGSGPEKAFSFLTTNEGRTKFWAESSLEKDGIIHFVFPDGTKYDSKVLKVKKAKEYKLVYFGGSEVTFNITPDGDGGCDLTLKATKVNPKYYCEERAGWISVLMSMKAAADFGIDLRNHDTKRTWNNGYCDN